MKDEIKETLDRTLEYLEGIDKTRGTKILTTNETNILLDYITNLQKQIEEYQKALDETMSEKIDLQEENQRLKENNQNMQVEMSRSWERIDKAIEYIKEYCIDEEFYINIPAEEKGIIEVLKILKGE